jgi:hypothetical protein
MRPMTRPQAPDPTAPDPTAPTEPTAPEPPIEFVERKRRLGRPGVKEFRKR